MSIEHQLGGGSWLGVRAYDRLGRPGVAGLVALTDVLALTRHPAHVARARTAARPAEATAVTPSRAP
ncbi:hypothetical protein [Streptomyces sp. NPDC054783]